jgi:hypothetical protein
MTKWTVGRYITFFVNWVFTVNSQRDPCFAQLESFLSFPTDFLWFFDSKNSFVFAGTGVWTQGFSLAKLLLWHLSHTSSPFYSGYFKDGVSWTICPGWLPTEILQISASQVARIIGMSHQHSLKKTVFSLSFADLTQLYQILIYQWLCRCFKSSSPTSLSTHYEILLFCKIWNSHCSNVCSLGWCSCCCGIRHHRKGNQQNNG